MCVTKKTGVLLAASMVLASTTVWADGNDRQRMFEVTVTNVTQHEVFTPIMVAAHGRHQQLFSVGAPASNELEQLAEGGNTAPLSAALVAGGATDVVTAAGPLPPGGSVTLHVKGDRKHDHVSVAAMLVPTNDAFFAVNNLRVPKRGISVYSPAYDAGTELNDELCINIPGPPSACAGEGYNLQGGEGYVYIHPGIHGVGDLSASVYDWRNPVAKISVKEIECCDD